MVDNQAIKFWMLCNCFPVHRYYHFAHRGRRCRVAYISPVLKSFIGEIELAFIYGKFRYINNPDLIRLIHIELSFEPLLGAVFPTCPLYDEYLCIFWLYQNRG